MGMHRNDRRLKQDGMHRRKFIRFFNRIDIKFMQGVHIYIVYD